MVKTLRVVTGGCDEKEIRAGYRDESVLAHVGTRICEWVETAENARPPPPPASGSPVHVPAAADGKEDDGGGGRRL